MTFLSEIQRNGYTKVYKVGKGKDKERVTSTNVDGLSYSGNGCAIKKTQRTKLEIDPPGKDTSGWHTINRNLQHICRQR